MKFKICLPLGIALLIAFSTIAKPLSNADKEKLFSAYSYWKSVGSGLGWNAVQSPFGRYLLLKNENSLLALKLEKHLPSKGSGQAARYSWLLLVDGKLKESGSFDIDEVEGKGSAKIEIGGFNCEWSSGDWVYFDSKLPEMEIAKTEATEKDELNNLSTLMWWSQDKLKSYEEDNFSNAQLRKAMDLEPKPSPDEILKKALQSGTTNNLSNQRVDLTR